MEIAAVVSGTEAAAEKAAKELSIPAALRCEELLKRKGIDAVVVIDFSKKIHF